MSYASSYIYLLMMGKRFPNLNADQICNENESTLIVDISLVMSHLHLLHFALSCVCSLARAKLVVRVIWRKKGNFEDGYTRRAYQSPLSSTTRHAVVSWNGLDCDPIVILMSPSSANYCFIFAGSGNYIALAFLINLQLLHCVKFLQMGWEFCLKFNVKVTKYFYSSFSSNIFFVLHHYCVTFNITYIYAIKIHKKNWLYLGNLTFVHI